MIKIEKVSYHDKKRHKNWHTVNGFYNSIRFYAITEANLKDNKIKINFAEVHNTSEEEEKEALKLGYKNSKNILELFTEHEKEIIINEIKKHLQKP